MNSDFKLGLGLDKDGRIASNLTELSGNTPMVSLSGYCEKYGIKSQIVAKLEYFNPLGSSKDRVALKMITTAEKEGKIKENTVIIEPTSGNTGIGLAYVCAIKKLKLILTMPDNMSIERIKLLKMLGAEIILTPAEEGMSGAINKANELAQKNESSFIPSQFDNPANPQAHRETTGPEILRDCYGKVEYFVAGAGTGGTITGTGEVLKEYAKAMGRHTKVIAVEPATSAVINGEKAGKHGLMGIGAGFIPQNLNLAIIDETLKVTDEQAYEAAREVAKTDGLLVGISSGAALYAAKEIALRNNDKHDRIVVLFTDSGERYISTPLFD